ncbi:MAG: Crp/Fnr family transcriptional regulator [Paludibacteraceae bacterium]|nr:Crp/Fnr family transcriptional regulator [Paludibacteraceae bacterium]
MKEPNTQPVNMWDMNPIWDVLTPEEKELLTAQVEVVEYKKNDIIHHEGDTPTHMMMLARGKVRIYKEGISQRQQIIRLLKPYDLFAYRAAIAGDEYNSCAGAFEDCVVYKLNRETFIRFMQSNNAFCYRILVALARDLAVSQVQTVSLTQKHIRGRLADSLLSLKEKYGYDADGALAVNPSREDMANMSNMTTSNAIRTLSQFAQEGLIRLEGRFIYLLNEEELHHISRLG